MLYSLAMLPASEAHASQPAGAAGKDRLRLCALLAFVFSIGSALHASRMQGWTYDEADHLAYSRRLLLTGETERRSYLQFNSKTPAVVPNVLAVRFAKRILGADDPSWQRLAARLPSVMWLGLLLLAVWAIAGRLAGPDAAHLALLLAALDPNLVANASLVTVDVAFTLAACLTLAAAAAFASRPGLFRALVLGAALGLAFVVKFAAFLLLPLVMLACVFGIARASDRRRASSRLVAGLTLAAGITVLVLSAGYRFKGVGEGLGAVSWRSGPLQTVAALAPGLRLPIPIDFLTGVDISFAQERAKTWPVLVLGETRGPVWYYYVFHWLFKTPVALIAALSLGLWLLLGTSRPQPWCTFVAVCLAFLLAYFSLAFRAQIGYRHALVCIPLACVLAGVGLAGLGKRGVVAPLVLVLAAAEQYPYRGNPLAFTNLGVLPKERAYLFFGDSSIDYGQDQEYAREWVATQPEAHLDPVHILRGRNVFGITTLYRHPWVLRNLKPQGHFRFSHVYYDVDLETFRTYLQAERVLEAGPDDARLCGPSVPSPSEGAFDLFPPAAPRDVFLLCVESARPTTLLLRGTAGFAAFGRPRERRKTWQTIGPGQVVWYWAPAGRHAIAIVPQKGSFSGVLDGDRGLALSLRTVTLDASGYLAPPVMTGTPTPAATQSSLTWFGSSFLSASAALRGKWAASASPTRATPLTIPSV